MNTLRKAQGSRLKAEVRPAVPATSAFSVQPSALWLRAGEAMALIGVHTRKQFLKMVEAANVRTLTDKDEMRARGQFAHGWQWYHRHDLERLRST